MDTDAAFALLKDQIEQAEWQEAAETAENLLEWLAKGGLAINMPRATKPTL